MARRALLIGIDAYEDASLRIPAAAQDVSNLAKVLPSLDFAPHYIEELTSGKGSGLSTNSLRRAIRQFVNRGEPGDHLVCYYSGHGAELDGARLLIPQDFYRDDPRPRSELIGDLEIYALARMSKADSVLVIIDACREGITFQIAPDPAATKGLETQSPSGTSHANQDVPTIALVYSCGQGERSHFVDGNNGFSYFTKALCDVLGKEGGPAKLIDIIGATQSHLDKLLPSQCKQKATLDERRIAGRAGSPEHLLVKSDYAERLRAQIERSSWCKQVVHSKLWPLVEGTSEGLADQVRVLVFRAEKRAQQAQEKLPGDRWRNPEMPMHVLRRLGQLLGSALERLLTGPEAAIALVTPYIYEAFIANAELLLLEEGNPLSPLSTPETVKSSRTWRALRNRLLSEESWSRRKRLLQERGRGDVAEDVAAWQLLRFLQESGELWEYTPGTPDEGKGWLNPALDHLFALGPFETICSDHRVGRILGGRRLVTMVRLLHATSSDIAEESAPEFSRRLNPAFRVGNIPDVWNVDEIKLAHLLSLAGAMALDPRHLPTVIAEHLGTDAEISPQTLHDVSSRAEWRPDERKGIALGLDCAHQAVDAALDEVVCALDNHRHELDHVPDFPGHLVQYLPAHFGNNVRAIERMGEPVYRRPHMRFHLDQRRVRELLMGRALYGNQPELALRELYQNALDACRYRRARDQYLRTIVWKDLSVAAYKGQIRFRAGHEDGRPYVECEDNGIGMAERHLRTLFAQAGRRFADSHEFHLEKGAWEEGDIPFYPNSRFGIGVFSYFMLSDEIVVETRRWGLEGTSFEIGLRAVVVGSGSLFRLQPLPGQVLPHGGTRVRLYLNNPDTRPVELLKTIDEWLWLPEFDTEIASEGFHQRLAAGELTPAAQNECGPVASLPGSEGKTGTPRAFWGLRVFEAKSYHYPSTDAAIDRTCIRLVDGVRPGEAFLSLGDRFYPGVIINLTGELRPELSVDRSRITSWEAGKEWLRSLIDEKGWESLVDLPGISVCTVSDLIPCEPRSAARLDTALRAGTQADERLSFVSGRSGDVLTLKGLGICLWDSWIAANAIGGTFGVRRFSFKLPDDPLLIRARICALSRSGLRVEDTAARLAAYDRQKNLCDVSLIAQLLLIPQAMSYSMAFSMEFSSGERLAKQEEIGKVDIVRVAAALAMPLEQVVGEAEALVKAGWTTLYEDVESLRLGLTPTEKTEQLLSTRAQGKQQWVKEIGPIHCIIGAAKYQCSVGEVLEEVKPFISSKAILLSDDIAGLPRDFQPSRRLGQLLSWDLNEYGLGFKEIDPAHCVRAAARWQCSLGEVLSEVESLPSGVVRVIDDVAGLPRDFQPSRRLGQLLSWDLNEYGLEVKEIDPAHCVRAAARWQCSLGEVLSEVESLPSGVVRVIDDVAGLPRDFQPSRRLGQLLSWDLNKYGLGFKEIDPAHCVRAAARSQCSLGEVLGEVELLKSLSIGFSSDALGTLVKDFRPTERVITLLEVAKSDKSMGSLWVGLLQVLHAASVWKAPLGEALDTAKLLVNAGMPFQIDIDPTKDENLRHAFPDGRFTSLVRYLEPKGARRPHLDPLDLFVHARETGLAVESFREALQALREEGVDVDECLDFLNYSA